MLSQVGCITLPPGTIDKLHRGDALNAAEQGHVDRLPVIAARLIADIPRMEPVRQILLGHEPSHDGRCTSAPTMKDDPANSGAAVLRIALDYDLLEARGLSPSLSLGTLRGRTGAYDPILIEALAELIGVSETECEVRELRVGGLRPGMILAEDVRMRSGGLLVARGQEVTESLIERLRNFSLGDGISEPLRVIVRTAPAPAMA